MLEWVGIAMKLLFDNTIKALEDADLRSIGYSQCLSTQYYLLLNALIDNNIDLVNPTNEDAKVLVRLFLDLLEVSRTAAMAIESYNKTKH